MIAGSRLWWRYWWSEWETIHATLSPTSAYYHYFHSLLTAPANALPPKHCFPTLKKNNPQLGLNADQSSAVWQSYRYTIYSTGVLKILSVLINFPLITLSLMNLLVQTSSHSPKNYGRDMQAGLMAIPHQARKWFTPIVLFRFKTQEQP